MQFIVLVEAHKENLLALHRHIIAKGSFLMLNWNIQSKTMSMNFSYSLIFKSISLYYTLNGSFTHMWYCDVVHWSFRKYQCIELCRSFNYETVIYIKKSYSLISPVISSWNSLSIEKLPSSHWQIQFSKILIFTWQLEFFIEVTGSLHFLRNVHQISKHAFILFFQYNIKLGISWKSHLQWLIAQTIA